MSSWLASPDKPGIYWVAPLDENEQKTEIFLDSPQYVFQPYAHLAGYLKALDPKEWHFSATMYDCKNSRPLRGRLVCPVADAPPLPTTESKGASSELPTDPRT